MEDEKLRHEDKIRKTAHQIERAVELIMAVFVMAAVVIEIVHLFPVIGRMADRSLDFHLYDDFLTYVLDIVIGAEFFRLLAAPDLHAVLEVMMFAMTRHMIIESASALDNLLTILGIGILAYIQYFMKGKRLRDVLGKKKEKEEEDGAE